jgi:formylglycine-generating enzyme required for sulfatase activity
MNNGKVRIYELSKELNLDNREMLDVCDQLNISVKSHSSTITEAEAARIRKATEKWNTGINTVRVYELSMELNLNNREILAVCDQLNISVKSHSSTITQDEAARIRTFAKENALSQASSKTQPPRKKKQILEIRKNRPLVEPPKRPETESTQEQRLSVRRTPRTRQGYIEPLLDVGSALPLHMVLIPGGTFLMGSPPDEINRSDSEDPQRHVTLPQFFIGRYPITQAQWRAVAALPQKESKLDPEPSRFKGDNYPVEQVSWHDAVEFCARLKQHTNRPYRLPSEAEWEYACRAGTTTPFYFGKTLTDELANYDASLTYADGPKGEYRKTTTPVDYFGIANAFGLSDMHGNVLEWCQDYWHKSYEGAPIDGSAYLTGNEIVNRVIRGGSWLTHPGACRSAYRYYDMPDNRIDYIGFRVVCSAPRTL